MMLCTSKASTIKRQYSSNSFLDVLLILIFLLPQNLILYIFIPVCFYVLSDNKIRHGKFLKLYFSLCFSIVVLSFLTNVFEPWMNIKGVFRAFELLVIFYFFGRQKYLYINKWTLIFLSIVIVVSQFSFLSPALTNFVDTWYPISEGQEVMVHSGADMDSVGSYSIRFGGLYRSPNDCAYYLNVLFALVIIERKQFDVFKFWTTLLLIFVGLALSGSRTGFAVTLAFYIIYLLNSNKKKLSGLISFFFILIILLFCVGDQIGEFRFFQISRGLNDSMTDKSVVFDEFLDNVNPLHFIFGCFTADVTKFVTKSGFSGVDSDLGNILVVYGIIFYFVLLGFLWSIIKRIKKEYRILFALFLWSISGSLILAYRPVALIMLILGIYFRKSELLTNSTSLVGIKELDLNNYK